MQIVLINTTIPEGPFKVNETNFNASDNTTLRIVYAQWRAISNDLKVWVG